MRKWPVGPQIGPQNENGGLVVPADLASHVPREDDQAVTGQRISRLVILCIAVAALIPLLATAATGRPYWSESVTEAKVIKTVRI